MAVRLTDEEIQILLAEPKPLPSNYRSRLQLRAKIGHRERELDIVGQHRSQFHLRVRQSEKQPLDFSVILEYYPSGSNRLFRLRRNNGKSHEHRNRLEKERFYGFHIHQATERYQMAGLDEDAFAQPTTSYVDLHGAIMCLLLECNFVIPPEIQMQLL